MEICRALARSRNLNGLYLLILNGHILALSDLIAAHHVVPRDDLASFGIDSRGVF
jgi:hypothetical protein